MKVLSRIFLSYLVIVGSLFPYMSQANPFTPEVMMSPVDMFNSPIYTRGVFIDLPEGRREVNLYRMLGFSDVPEANNANFKAALKTGNFVLSMSPSELGRSSQYYSFLDTAEGRQNLLRHYKGAFSALSVVTGDNLSVRTQSLSIELRAQVMNEGFYNLEPDQKIKFEKIQLEVNRRLLASFPVNQLERALDRTNQAQRVLSHVPSRAAYNLSIGVSTSTAPSWKSNFSITNQVRNFKGQRIQTVTDPFGRKVDIAVQTTAEGAQRVSGRQMMADLKSGTIQTGLVGLAFMVIIFGSSELAMITDYKSNPLKFEQTLDQTMSWAMPSSLASFFVIGDMAGRATNYLDISRKSTANLISLVQNRKMYANNPQLYSQQIKAQMAVKQTSTFLSRATSYPGMTAGFLGSQLVFGLVDRYVDKLESCRQLLISDEYLQNGSYTPSERSRLEQACDKTFGSIAQDLISSPQTWVQLTALLSTKALLTFGMGSGLMADYAIANQKALQTLRNTPKRSFIYKVKIVSRGLLATPLVSTVVGFVVFSLVFWAISEALNWGVKRLTINVPATQAAANIRELMATYQAQGWDMNKLCDDRNILQGELLDYLKPLAFWSDTNKCGETLIKAFIENHAQVNTTWRKSLTDPVQQAISNWNEYLFKANNIQNASKLLYKDIAEQIKAQRNSGRKVKFNRVYNIQTNAKEPLGYANTHLYNHPLPLFRSEPYFGWDYKLNTDLDTNIPYPVYNGKGVSWNERYTSNYGVSDLTQRKNKFLSDVLPKVITTLEARYNSGVDENEKRSVSRILRFLKFKNQDGSQNFSKIAQGLDFISQQLEKNPLDYPCRIANNCYWIEFQKEFFNPEIWAVDPDSKAKFMKGQDYFAGYKTSQYDPAGVKPIGPGQEFFIRYSNRLSNNNVDPYYYDSAYFSMTDYLLKQMVCGVDVKNGESMMANWFTYKMGWASPEFKAPRISLKGNMDPCFGDESNNRWRLAGPAQSPSFYNYMEDVKNPNVSYGGIVEFLYNEADDDFVQNFDLWWQTHVAPQFIQVIEKLNQDYFLAKVIDTQLADLISEENTDNNCFELCRDFKFEHKNGFSASIKQEMDTLYTYFFVPMIQGLNLDLRASDVKDQNQARQKIQKDFNNLRSDIYDIYMLLSGRTPNLTKNSLSLEFQDLLAQVSAEQLLLNPDYSQNYEVLKLKALDLLLKQKDYQMRILTRTEAFTDIVAIKDSSILLLNEMTMLSESEKQEKLDNINANVALLVSEFDDMSNRNGKVILEYNDYKLVDGVEISPTLKLVSSSQDRIMEITKELFDLQEQKYMFGLAR